MTEYRTFNTSIEGQPLIAATNGLDIRALQFTNFLKQLPPMTGTTGPSELSTMYASEMIQASVGHFLVYACTGTNVLSNIYIGPDTADQATNYHSLFNLQSETDIRVLDFVKFNASESNQGGGAVNLSNNTNTSDYVTVDGVGSGQLFEQGAPLGERILVTVQKTSPTGVNFTIMPGCCARTSEENIG